MNRQTTLYSITNHNKGEFFFFLAALSFMNKNDESVSPTLPLFYNLGAFYSSQGGRPDKSSQYPFHAPSNYIYKYIHICVLGVKESF